MATVSLKLKMPRRQEIQEILGKVRYMEQKAVNWLFANKKSGITAVHSAFYDTFRQQFPKLHSHWVVNALKTATGIASSFRKAKKKQKSKGKTQRKPKLEAKRPKLRKPFVSLSPHLFKVSWDGRWRYSGGGHSNGCCHDRKLRGCLCNRVSPGRQCASQVPFAGRFNRCQNSDGTGTGPRRCCFVGGYPKRKGTAQAPHTKGGVNGCASLPSSPPSLLLLR